MPGNEAFIHSPLFENMADFHAVDRINFFCRGNGASVCIDCPLANAFDLQITQKRIKMFGVEANKIPLSLSVIRRELITRS